MYRLIWINGAWTRAIEMGEYPTLEHAELARDSLKNAMAEQCLAVAHDKTLAGSWVIKEPTDD